MGNDEIPEPTPLDRATRELMQGIAAWFDSQTKAMERDLGDYFTVASLANYFQISQRAVLLMAQQGHIESYRVGPDYRFSTVAVERYLEERRADSGARWVRVVIEMEEPEVEAGEIDQWTEHIVTGQVDGEDAEIEPVEREFRPRTINWRVEEYRAPAAP